MTPFLSLVLMKLWFILSVIYELVNQMSHFNQKKFTQIGNLREGCLGAVFILLEGVSVNFIQLNKGLKQFSTTLRPFIEGGDYLYPEKKRITQ